MNEGENEENQGSAQEDLRARENVTPVAQPGVATVVQAKNAKKVLPIVVIAGIFILAWGVLSVVGQSLFPFAYMARSIEDWNSTETSTKERSDDLADSQLANANETSSIAETIFDDAGFSDEQVESFEAMGLEVESLDDGSVAMVYEDGNGKTAVVSSKTVSVLTGKEVLASSEVIYDAGEETLSDEEARVAILEQLGLAADANKVETFSEAMSGDKNFRDKYIRAASAWRGSISGWFNEMTETVMDRLGISRDNFSNYKSTNDEAKDEEAFLELAKSKAAAGEGSDIGDKSFNERVKEVASNSSDDANCGTSSAFTDIESVINADQTARQVSAASLFMEATDKTKAGDGNEAPLNSATNIIMRSGGAQTEGIYHLFAGSTIHQTNEAVQKVSAQTHGTNESILGTLGDDKEYRECIYEGNTDPDLGDNNGAIVKIGSMFKRLGGWIKSAFSGLGNIIKSLFELLAGGSSSDDSVARTEQALAATSEAYEQMKNQSYFNGNDTDILGEGLVTGTERIFGEKAKSAAQVAGDVEAARITYRAQQEIIAENAEIDRTNKSPFDLTSRNTFLGSIAYSLIPFATSAQSVSVTSTVSNVGNIISNALTKLLPTSSAVGEAQLIFGDCVLANNAGAASNAHCNSYYNTDLELTDTSPVTIFENVAKLRYDSGGYKFSWGTANGIGGVTRKNTSDANYGDAALNPAENALPAHYSSIVESIKNSPTTAGWSGEANGCETAWNFRVTTSGLYYYYFDQPLEWTYSRYTNFEYEGYQSGWPNRTSSGGVGRESAKNEKDPGLCELDISVQNGQPVVNKNGALGVFLIASGQRTSEWGVTDDSVLQLITKSDFTKGRLHPCYVNSDECSGGIYQQLQWSGQAGSGRATDDFVNRTAQSQYMSRWIGGSAYTMYDGGGMEKFDSLKTGFDNDKRFQDPTRGNDYFWNENKWYQAYVELLEWLQAAGKVQKTSTSVAVKDYYTENPLDNSYTGIIARYSGLSKERVVAVLDLLEYVAFLENYDPTNLYPMPKPAPAELRYDNNEIVAEAEKIIQNVSIVYEELRNKTVTV